MLMARHWEMKPRDIAQVIISHLKESEYVEKVELAGPGFINFFLSGLWMSELIREIIAKGEDYGKRDLGRASVLKSNLSAQTNGTFAYRPRPRSCGGRCYGQHTFLCGMVCGKGILH